jgi:hypothetical protein
MSNQEPSYCNDAKDQGGKHHYIGQTKGTGVLVVDGSQGCVDPAPSARKNLKVGALHTPMGSISQANTKILSYDQG